MKHLVAAIGLLLLPLGLNNQKTYADTQGGASTAWQSLVDNISVRSIDITEITEEQSMANLPQVALLNCVEVSYQIFESNGTKDTLAALTPVRRAWTFPPYGFISSLLDRGINCAQLGETREIHAPASHWENLTTDATYIKISVTIHAIQPGLQIDILNPPISDATRAQGGDMVICSGRYIAAADLPSAQAIVAFGNIEPADKEDTIIAPEWHNFTQRPLACQSNDPQFILGLRAGIRQIAIGETRRLIIPPQMAYQDNSVGGDLIPPNSWLVMELQCQRITAQEDLQNQ